MRSAAATAGHAGHDELTDGFATERLSSTAQKDRSSRQSEPACSFRFRRSLRFSMPSNPPSSISPSSNSSALPCATDASGTKVAHSSTPPRRSRSALSSTRAATTSTRIAHAPSAGSVLTRAAVGDRTSAAATCQRRSARIRSARALAAAARSAVVCGPAPLRVGGGGGGQTARCTNVRRASASAASIVVHRSRVTRY